MDSPQIYDRRQFVSKSVAAGTALLLTSHYPLANAKQPAAWSNLFDGTTLDGWLLGKGKIFYFRPGHETFPIYYDRNVRRILGNAVRWAAPSGAPYHSEGRNIVKSLNPIRAEHQVDDELHKTSSENT